MLSMYAAIKLTAGDAPCVVKWSGRVGLSVGVETWCGQKIKAADGVMQLPTEHKPCSRCETALKLHAARHA